MRPPGAGGGDTAAAAKVPVVVTPARRDTMEAFLDSSCTVEAEETIEVVSQATGVVVEVLAEEGDRVRAGQLLARLAYEELELAEERARTQFERLQADFDRSQKLAEENLVSEEDFSKIRFDLTQAEIDWKQKQLELARTKITSPIHGTITERLIHLGELKRENEAVYRLVDFSSLTAPVYVPEKYIRNLRVGQQAFLATPSLGGRRIAGKVRRISPVVDSQSGTVKVIIDPGSEKGLRPGMFANVQLVLDRHEDTVVIPKKAIIYEDELPYVFVVEEGIAHKRRLELGYQDELRAEAVSGVGSGEQVVLVGQSALKDGSAVMAEDEQGEAITFEAAGPGDSPS